MGYFGRMPASKAPVEFDPPPITWQQLRGWINSNARGLLEFAREGYSEVGRGVVILAGSSEADQEIRCRYIKSEEFADIRNEALDLAHKLVAKYDPENEFVVVTVDGSSHVTSALVAVETIKSEIVH